MSPAGFRHRGVVEGFYGPPLSGEDRRWLVERIGRWGMNVYLHAPKDDPLHRDRWREPYPAEALAEFAALIELGARHGVDVGFAVSPGLSMSYASREDRGALARKLASFAGIGSRWLCLALDDVPSALVHGADRDAFDSLAAAHVAVAHEVAAALGPEVTLWLVPTDYLGIRSTPYLEALGAALDPRIEVGWTGRTVLSPGISCEEAAERAATLRRPVLVWDNYPVTDGPMRTMLHLGPYEGRDPDLPRHASGVLLNPMQHIRASAPALASAARYLNDPAGYDAEAAWREALAEVGRGAPDAFALFAAAHRFSALAPGERDAELEATIGALEAALHASRDPGPELAKLERQLDARARVGETLRNDLDDMKLRAEIEPWIVSHGVETRRMQAALRALSALFGPAPRRDRVLAFVAMEGSLTREPPAACASYGPRRVLYPQLVSMDDTTMGFGPDPSLFTGACLSDALLALTEGTALARLGTGD